MAAVGCWGRRRLSFAIMTVALVASVLIATAPAAKAEPVLGGQIYSTGAPVEIEVLSATAGLTSELWLFEPGPERFVATNRQVGTVVELGSFPSGAELVFGIRSSQGEFRMGPASRNPDGIVHAVVDFPKTGRRSSASRTCEVAEIETTTTTASSSGAGSRPSRRRS